MCAQDVFTATERALIFSFDSQFMVQCVINTNFN